MKKYLIITLCTISSLNSMEQQIVTREPREWNAPLYAKGNKVQFESALAFLKKNNINIKNKRILDVGCGTGDIAAVLTETAATVHGVDASKNMIQYATNKYGNVHDNLSFEQSFAEDFITKDKKYDLATTFFCFHWLSDKKQALTQISQSLTENGELFGIFPTVNDPHPARFTIGTQMVTELYPNDSLSVKLGRSEPTLEELKIMLTETGFEIITCELQTHNVILPDRQAVEDFQRPVVMSRPFIQKMSLQEAENFFTEFINRTISLYPQTEDGQLIEEVTTRIVHARKITK
jgi:ubiquinone/menaquinone biosynthesis C-methylase UbiE